MRLMFTFLFAVILIGCGGDPNAKKQPVGSKTSANAMSEVSPADVELHNQAVALAAQFKFKEAEPLLKSLAEKYDHPDLAIDHGIATAHRQIGGAAGIPAFEVVLKKYPTSIRAKYCLAYLYYLNGRTEDAIELLKSVSEQVYNSQPSRFANDPHVAYLLGACYQDLGDKEQDALKWLTKALELDPYFFNASHRRAGLVRQLGKDNDEVEHAMRIRSILESHPLATHNNTKHFRLGPMFDIAPLDFKQQQTAEIPKGNIFAKAEPLAKVVDWSCKPSQQASVTICDINNDGKLDVFFAGINAKAGGGEAPNAIFFQQEDGSFKLDLSHPLAKVVGVQATLWGDVDNDGMTDCFFCRKGPCDLWRQDPKAGWVNATQKMNAAGPGANIVSGVMFDADHDSDLDILLVCGDGPNEYLQNDGKGSFKLAAKEVGLQGPNHGTKQALVGFLNKDRVYDVVFIGEKPPHDVCVFQPTGVYKSMSKEFEEWKFFDKPFAESPLDSAIASGHQLFAAKKDRLIGPGSAELDIKRTGREPMISADLDGDGTLDLIASDANGVIKYKLQGDAPSSGYETAELPALGTWTLANLDPKRGPALVGLPSDGSAPIIAKPGDGRFDYLSLSFVGDKKHVFQHRSNRSGIGVFVRLRFGDRWTEISDLGNSSAAGQSLQPLAIGTGGAPKADFIFIDWSNGDFQSEYPLAASKLHVIKELDRTPEDSCPLFFAWDGEKYAFVSDFLGVGGIDYLVRPGEWYTPSDPRENFLMPKDLLVPKQGRLHVKILEAVEEMTFIDRAALVAYDVPPGWKMTLDERHSALPPKPTHEPRFYRTEVPLAKAIDGKGMDVTLALATADNRSAPPPLPDSSLPGRFLEDHSVTLMFAKPIDRGPGSPMLIANGWVCYPNAQSTIAASQSGHEFRAPRLEAMAKDGSWKVIYPEFGYVAGMQREMSLPLVNLPEECTTLRISTELQVYWDSFVVAFAEPCKEARKVPLKTEVAKLSAAGSPKYTPNDGDRPFGFDYSVRNPFWPSRAPSGFYTRFGECGELAADEDDAVVTIGPGEELHLEFTAPDALMKDWTRRYVLESRGWCRGMRIYTRNGQTVEPLPTTGKPAEKRDRLHKKYNTRWVGG